MARRYHCRPGKRYYYGELEFWAQGGMCHIFDHRDFLPDGRPMPDDKRVVSISPRDFKRRAAAIGRCINLEQYGGDRLAKTNLANNMTRCAEEAIFQGDMTSRRVSDHRIRHRQICGNRSNGVTLGKSGRGARAVDALAGLFGGVSLTGGKPPSRQADLPTGMSLGGAADLHAVSAQAPASGTVLPTAVPGMGRLRGQQVERRVYAEHQVGTGECG